MNYTLCAISGIELVAGKRGQIFLTLRGYIKLSGKPKQTISERTTRGFLAGKVLETTALTVPGRGNRPCKLIPADLALEWLANDNPELAEAIGDDLVGFLQQGLDLSQFHKPKTASPITGIPVMGSEIIPTTEPTPTASGNLERYDQDGIELVINTKTGEAFATLAGYSRMSGIAKNTLANRLSRGYKGVHKTSLPTAEIETGGGVQGVHLLSADIVYDWMFEDNSALARVMGKVGATIYMHQLAGFKITSDAIAKPQPEPTPAPAPHLTTAERLKIATEADRLLAKYGMDTNPRFKQAAQDFMGDILGLNQSALPAPDAQKWYGVAERAEQLGYPVALVLKHRSQLGRWVAQHVGGSRKEDRLCNGTQRPINLYPASSELDAAIAAYLKNFY